METQTPHWRRVAPPAAFALLCLIRSFLTCERFGGDLPLQPVGYRVEAPLPSASNLPAGADVQMAGVVVGRVAAVRRDGDRAIATLEMRSAYAPLRRSARLVVRTKTLLGEGYVEIAPGPRSAPAVPEGGRLAASQVRPNVALDEFLETFDGATRARMRALFAGLATAYGERSRELNDTLAHAAPLASHGASVFEAVDAQRRDLERLLAASGDVFAAAGARAGTLQAAVRAGDEVLSATGERDRALAATVRAMPGFLRELGRTSDRVTAASGDLTRATDALTGVAPLVAPALREVRHASPLFERLFGEMPGTIASGRRGLPELRRIVAAVPRGLDDAYPAARELIPLMQMFAQYAQSAVIGTLGNTGSLTNGKLVGPGGKIISRAAGAVTISNESVGGWVRKLPTNRSNAYPKPGAFRAIATKGFLASYDCRHTGNPLYLPPLGTGAPPCEEQGPWEFNGRSASYPRLRPAPP